MNVVQVFQDDVDAYNNVGQSLALDSAAENIIRARVSPAQTAGVNWELSANGGATFQPLVPDAWTELTSPGTDVLWRSSLSWSPGTDPVVSNVTVDWLNDSASITSVQDIPNDQGLQVSVEWTRSGHDFVGDPQQIVEYAVYRQIDSSLSRIPGRMPTPSFDDLSPVARADAERMLQAGWYFLLTVPVLTEDSYAVVVPTLADSTITGGQHLSTFRVTSLTATPGVFFHSPPVSGYSVDNLAPGVPQGIAANYGPDSVGLDWLDAPEIDFQFYRVFRSTDPDFIPSPATLVQETSESSWTDVVPDAWSYHYKIATVDFSGNEGLPGSADVVTDAPASLAGSVFALQPAAPNPFHAATTIAYALPASGPVDLAIYDVAGRKILSLVDDVRPAGRHAVRWNGRNAEGRAVAAGVYLYRLRVGSQVKQERMVLLR